MAESKAESIKVNVTKKSDESPQRTSREGAYLGPDVDTDDSKADSDNQSASTSHQGKVIKPTASATDAAAAESEEAPEQSSEAEPTAASTINTPVTPDETLDDESDESEQIVDAHATQHAALVDNRDYKISKKQLKKAPQASHRHSHKAWVFVMLVTLVSLGLAYGYLSVVEGMSLDEITTKLGL